MTRQKISRELWNMIIYHNFVVDQEMTTKEDIEFGLKNKILKINMDGALVYLNDNIENVKRSSGRYMFVKNDRKYICNDKIRIKYVDRRAMENIMRQFFELEY